MKATICDICHQPIDKDSDAITMLVIETRAYRAPDIDKMVAGGKKAVAAATQKLIDEKAKPKLTVNLDLHRQCYLDRIHPAIREATS